MRAIGDWDCQLSLLSVTRAEPLNELPPCFVTALMTPPVKRPNSAETPDVIVVVSWMASSMTSVPVGVPRMLSWMLTPLTVKTLSNDCAPETVVLPPGPFVLTPGVRTTDERIVRAIGSLFVISVE